jgi:hypothetical protein
VTEQWDVDAYISYIISSRDLHNRMFEQQDHCFIERAVYIVC